MAHSSSKRLRFVPRGPAWLAAIMLTLFGGALVSASTLVLGVSIPFWESSPRIGALVSLFGVVAPIAIVAVAHQTGHAVLDRLGKKASPRGFRPGLMSWWAGLYAWLVMTLASATSMFVVMVIHPELGIRGLFGMVGVSGGLASWVTIPTAVWVLMAAGLYQVERLVRERMAADPDSIR